MKETFQKGLKLEEKENQDLILTYICMIYLGGPVGLPLPPIFKSDMLGKNKVKPLTLHHCPTFTHTHTIYLEGP